MAALLAGCALAAAGGSPAGAGAAAYRAAGAGRGGSAHAVAVITYTYRSNLGQARSREAAFSDGPGTMLVVGGVLGATRSATAGAEILDTSSGVLRQAGMLAAPLAEAAEVRLGDEELLLGGSVPAAGGLASSAGTASARVWRIGLAARRGGGLTAALTGTLPEGRAGAGAAVLDGRVYLAGGYRGALDLGRVVTTDDGHHFSAGAELAEPVRYPAVVADDGAVYVLGGEVLYGGVPEPVGTVQVITPGAPKARVVAELPEPVAAAVAWVVSGTLYVAGGDSELSSSGSGQLTSGSIWAYDSRRHLFELAGYLALPVSHAAVIVEGAKAAVVGGEFQGGPVATVQEVAPAGR